MREIYGVQGKCSESEVVQEAWGEDMLLTSHMGVAMASGMSKNSSWDRPDAVVPVCTEIQMPQT